MADTLYHALVLSLHQPSGNLEHLLAHDEWAAREILCAMDRIPRSLAECSDQARIHLSLSGTLLETLSDPRFQERAYGIVDCGALLWQLRSTPGIDVLGTGYYYPVLPLVPPADWDAQVERWQGIGGRLFSLNEQPGFWAPEMGFCMEMIPLLRRHGYRYVLVDSEHVQPVTAMRWEELRYQPHLLLRWRHFSHQKPRFEPLLSLLVWFLVNRLPKPKPSCWLLTIFSLWISLCLSLV